MNYKLRDFFDSYTGLGSKAAMEMIYNLDYDSINTWSTKENTALDLYFDTLYNGFWEGMSTKELADDLMITLQDVLAE